MNTLAEKYPNEIQAILAKYPADKKRSAVMPLIYLAQREENYVNRQTMREVAEICEISPTEVASITSARSITIDR